LLSPPKRFVFFFRNFFMSGTGVGGSNLGAPVQVGKQRNADATIYVGELDGQVNEEILWELFLQVGPVVYVHIPKDKVTNQHSGFGFVEFQNEIDAEYAAKVMAGVRVFGKAIRINRANSQRKAAAASLDVGANLFIGSLSTEVDERLLYDTFSRFGMIVSTPKVMRDEQGESKGFAFVSFSDFESSDAAIAALNGQYLAGRPISVAYAIKKDSKGERHGTEAERLLAAQRRMQQGNVPRPPVPGFVGGPPQFGAPMMMPPPPPQFGNLMMMPPPPPIAGWNRP
jgi:splicing factor 3B subunit 4